MVSNKTGKNMKPPRTPIRRKRQRVMIYMLTIIASAVVVGVFLFDKYSNNTKPQPAAKNGTPARQSADSSSTVQNDLTKIVGRWLRPDGGYVIEIAKVDTDGSLDAAYFNPRPINVSQAAAAIEEGKLHIFIELQDVGYPGARYSLVYVPQDDTLKGLYYQPSVGQSFEVVFVRKFS